MPVIDSATIDQGILDSLPTDICIIGSGPAGSTIARELSAKGLRVTILESGGLQRQAETDSLNETENIGWPRLMDPWEFRNRIVGGSSHTWCGRSAPFDDIDFEERDWVPYSGWPFKLDDLIPYLDRAADYVGLSLTSEYNSDQFWRLTGHKAPDSHLDPAKLLPCFWQFSADHSNRYDYMRFGPHLIDHIGPNLTLITNATVVHINAVSSGEAVKSVEFAALDGRRWMLPAQRIVLCGGGIDNARLLLCSDNVMSCGLGNAQDTVGRFLMDHPRGQVAGFPLVDVDRLMKHFGYFRARGRLFEYGMRLSPKVQREESLLNCGAWIGQTMSLDDPWYSVVRFLRRKAKLAHDSLNIVSHLNLIISGAYEYFVLRRGLKRKWTRIGFDCMCEQQPDRDSRITLAERRDRQGMRLARIDWRMHEQEARTMRRIAELAVEQFPRLGLPAPIPDEWVRDRGMLPRTFIDIGHPTGATRMSVDPRYGVVDANCQVHGVHGLFIAGSSVFPTTGHANPTQMIVALALRLADHLKSQPVTRLVRADNAFA